MSTWVWSLFTWVWFHFQKIIFLLVFHFKTLKTSQSTVALQKMESISLWNISESTLTFLISTLVLFSFFSTFFWNSPQTANENRENDPRIDEINERNTQFHSSHKNLQRSFVGHNFGTRFHDIDITWEDSKSDNLSKQENNSLKRKADSNSSSDSAAKRRKRTWIIILWFAFE